MIGSWHSRLPLNQSAVMINSDSLLLFFRARWLRDLIGVEFPAFTFIYTHLYFKLVSTRGPEFDPRWDHILLLLTRSIDGERGVKWAQHRPQVYQLLLSRVIDVKYGYKAIFLPFTVVASLASIGTTPWSVITAKFSSSFAMFAMAAQTLAKT